MHSNRYLMKEILHIKIKGNNKKKTFVFSQKCDQ